MIPAYLPYGIVSIYGIGSPISVTGIVGDTNQRFGVINQMSQYNISYYNVGDHVLFDEKDVVCRLAYTSGRYTLVPAAKLALREIIPP